MISSQIKVGVLGFGTVGAGAVELLLTNQEMITQRVGVEVVLHRIADLDVTSDRGIKAQLPEGALISDAEAVIRECDIIVELIGGKGIAKSLILKALELGKPVVTANKALLADFGEALFAMAEKHNTNLYYEASVGGGIPIIKSLRESFVANHINAMYGILNGTCNYILTRMDSENMSFAPALAEAQQLGFAETNPALDIDGIDTAHKIAILASLAYGEWFGTESVYVEGIRKIDVCDLKYAKQLGYRIKLLGIARQIKGNVEIRVHPALVPKKKLIAQIDGVFNAVDVNGDYVGDALFSGRGAGRQATASAVVADVIDAALDLSANAPRRRPPFLPGRQYRSLTPLDDVITRHYMRMCCHDMVGAYAKITSILSANNVSISGIMQRESHNEDVTVLMMTHPAKEGDAKRAVAQLELLPEAIGEVIRIRVEDW